MRHNLEAPFDAEGTVNYDYVKPFFPNQIALGTQGQPGDPPAGLPTVSTVPERGDVRLEVFSPTIELNERHRTILRGSKVSKLQSPWPRTILREARARSNLLPVF